MHVFAAGIEKASSYKSHFSFCACDIGCVEDRPRENVHLRSS